MSDPVTFVRMGEWETSTVLAVIGLLVIFPLVARKNPFSFLISIATVTILARIFGLISFPVSIVAKPDFESVFLKLDVMGALHWALLPSILVLVFTDLFDSLSTFVGVAKAGNLIDEKGNPLRLREGLIVDSFATFFAGLLGTSSGTTFIESAAGIEAGARSGFASVVTAFCFLPFLFFSPLLGMVPAYATAPVLICVGLMMFRNIVELDTKKIEDWVPAVVTILLIPLAFSITKGFLCGLFLHTVLYVLTGRLKEISSAMWILGVLSGTLLWVGI